MIWLVLCEDAWKLYDDAVRSGNWRKYLHHRKTCKECRKEEK